ncbi:hypothetical protein Fmac_032746 [Flemingia macrophylla]|uniref:Uncharacterized protein n=1 Tax=Flemingia macrophylla TaxID=520843 RepID=A0ABD1L5T1_9FABA
MHNKKSHANKKYIHTKMAKPKCKKSKIDLSLLGKIKKNKKKRDSLENTFSRKHKQNP